MWVILKNLTKCDVIVSNMVETFNDYTMYARSKHLIDMLEEIRTMLVKRLVTKRYKAQKWICLICPKVHELLEKEKEEVSYYYTFSSCLLHKHSTS